VVQLGTQGLQTGHGVAQTLAARQLGKRHAQKLIVTTQLTNAVIALIVLDTLAEFVTGKKIHQLTKYSAAFVQDPPLC